MKKIFAFVSLMLIFSMLLVSCGISQSDIEKTTSTSDSTTGPSDLDPSEGTIAHKPGLTHDLTTFYENVDTHKVKYTYEEMIVDLYAMKTEYKELGNIFNIKTLGKSLDGRVIECAVLGNPKAANQIVVQAGIHGREYLTSMLVMRQLEYYLDNYKTGTYNGTDYEYLFSNFAFYIIPMANPDGMVIAEEGIDAIRSEELRNNINEIYERDLKKQYATLDSGKVLSRDEYLEYWKANAAGVDLNRNYDALWNEYVGESEPCFLNYKGASAESEPETVAMVELIESLSNVTAVIAVHSQGRMIYWDCDQSGKLADQCEKLAYLTKSLTNYRIHPDTVQDASFTDWAVLEKGIPAITVEVGDGEGYSLLTIDKFNDAWKENYLLWVAIADHFIN